MRRLAVDDLRQLAERPKAVLGARLGDVLVESGAPSCVHLGTELLDDVIDGQAGVPDVEVAHACKRRHRRPVRTTHLRADATALLFVETAIPAGNGEARDQSLDVPFERTRMGFVEVVQAEYELSIRSGVDTEVRQVGIATQLDVETGGRAVREVRRHRVRGTAEEGEGRYEHPAVSNRDELGHAGLGLLLEEFDRVRPVKERLPCRVCRARHLGACRPAASGALGNREVLDRLRLVRHGQILPQNSGKSSTPTRPDRSWSGRFRRSRARDLPARPLRVRLAHRHTAGWPRSRCTAPPAQQRPSRRPRTTTAGSRRR